MASRRNPPPDVRDIEDDIQPSLSRSVQQTHGVALHDGALAHLCETCSIFVQTAFCRGQIPSASYTAQEEVS